MSAPKAFLKVGGVTIIAREIRALGSVFGELLVVANDPARYNGLGVRVIPDTERFGALKGPLIGLYSGLSASSNDHVFLAACDMPFIEPGLVRWMAGLRRGHDVVIPRINGLTEPLFGLYSKRALPVIEEALLKGTRRLQDIFGALDARYVGPAQMRAHDPELKSLTNINTPGELARARKTAIKRASAL
jgi:molybdopterin-guanine dinucleotide biosynthesis protein A